MSREAVEFMARLSTTAGSMALVFVIFSLTEVARARLSVEYAELLTRMYLTARHVMGMIMGGIAVMVLLSNAGVGVYLIQRGSFPLECTALQAGLLITFFLGLGILVATTALFTLFEIAALPATMRELEETLYE